MFVSINCWNFFESIHFSVSEMLLMPLVPTWLQSVMDPPPMFSSQTGLFFRALCSPNIPFAFCIHTAPWVHRTSFQIASGLVRMQERVFFWWLFYILRSYLCRWPQTVERRINSIYSYQLLLEVFCSQMEVLICFSSSPTSTSLWYF